MRYALLFLGILLIGCHNKAAPISQSPVVIEPYAPANGSVGFDLIPGADLSDGTRVWSAVYKSNEGTALFGLQIFPTHPSSGIEFGKGKFIAIPGSQPTPLLRALQKALEAKSLPHSTQRLEELPFTIAIIGKDLHRSTEGDFDGNSTGGWTAAKIFLPGHHNEDAEVFLNFNSVLKKGEFSIKDPDYGDDVLSQLAKVL